MCVRVCPFPGARHKKDYSFLPAQPHPSWLGLVASWPMQTLQWRPKPEGLWKEYRCYSPVLCSVMGAVARGTDLRSKGFSDGSRVYCCRALSKPGMDTVKPRGQWERGHSAWKEWQNEHQESPMENRPWDRGCMTLRKPLNSLSLYFSIQTLLDRIGVGNKYTYSRDW